MGYDIIASKGYDIEDDATSDAQDTVAYTIGRRDANISGEKRIIYCIVLRGTESAGEWLSNIDTGVSPDADHEGFRRIANAFISEILKYITTKAEDNIIWIMGHSRGGAVANLLGATITNSQNFALRDNIYVYTYGSPNTTTKAGIYDNIYNIVNPDDIITMLPPDKWGFHRFGDTIELSRDAAVYKKMKHNFYELTEGTEYISLGGTEEFKKIVTRWCRHLKIITIAASSAIRRMILYQSSYRTFKMPYRNFPRHSLFNFAFIITMVSNLYIIATKITRL